MYPDLVQGRKIYSPNGNVYWIEPKRDRWIYFYYTVDKVNYNQSIEAVEIYRFIDTEHYFYLIFLYCLYHNK